MSDEERREYFAQKKHEYDERLKRDDPEKYAEKKRKDLQAKKDYYHNTMSDEERLAFRKKVNLYKKVKKLKGERDSWRLVWTRKGSANAKAKMDELTVQIDALEPELAAAIEYNQKMREERIMKEKLNKQQSCG